MPSYLSILAAAWQPRTPLVMYACTAVVILGILGVVLRRHWRRDLSPGQILVALPLGVVFVPALLVVLAGAAAVFRESNFVGAAVSSARSTRAELWCWLSPRTSTWDDDEGPYRWKVGADDPDRVDPALLAEACLRASAIVLRDPPQAWDDQERDVIRKQFERLSERPELITQRALTDPKLSREERNENMPNLEGDGLVPVGEAFQYSKPAKICIYVDAVRLLMGAPPASADDDPAWLEFMSLVLLHEAGHLCRECGGLFPWDGEIPGDASLTDMYRHSAFGVWLQGLAKRPPLADDPLGPLRLPGACVFHQMVDGALKTRQDAGKVLRNEGADQLKIPAGPDQWGLAGFQAACEHCPSVPATQTGR